MNIISFVAKMFMFCQSQDASITSRTINSRWFITAMIFEPELFLSDLSYELNKSAKRTNVLGHDFYFYYHNAYTSQVTRRQIYHRKWHNVVLICFFHFCKQCEHIYLNMLMHVQQELSGTWLKYCLKLFYHLEEID